MFAVAVRRILSNAADGRYHRELFLAGSAAIAGLLLVAMAMQLVVAQRAEGLAAEVVFTVGVHFVGVLIGLWGFIMATTAFAQCCEREPSPVLPVRASDTCRNPRRF